MYFKCASALDNLIQLSKKLILKDPNCPLLFPSALPFSMYYIHHCCLNSFLCLDTFPSLVFPVCFWHLVSNSLLK